MKLDISDKRKGKIKNTLIDEKETSVKKLLDMIYAPMYTKTFYAVMSVAFFAVILVIGYFQYGIVFSDRRFNLQDFY